jgi:hypothetical protein
MLSRSKTIRKSCLVDLLFTSATALSVYVGVIDLKRSEGEGKAGESDLHVHVVGHGFRILHRAGDDGRAAG